MEEDFCALKKKIFFNFFKNENLFILINPKLKMSLRNIKLILLNNYS